MCLSLTLSLYVSLSSALFGIILGERSSFISTAIICMCAEDLWYCAPLFSAKEIVSDTNSQHLNFIQSESDIEPAKKSFLGVFFGHFYTPQAKFVSPLL